MLRIAWKACRSCSAASSSMWADSLASAADAGSSGGASFLDSLFGGFGTVIGLLAKGIMPGRDPGGAIATVLMGASRLSQIEDNLKALQNLAWTDDELARIDKILAR